MDVDGVLTDGRLWLSDQGTESKCFSTRDGFALAWARKFGLKTGVISGRKSAGTELRCRDLRMDEIHLGFLNKAEVFDEIRSRLQLEAGQFVFIGDDIIDLPLVKRCGVSAAPRDCHAEMRTRVDILLDFPGGNGAVRQMIDLWLIATGKWDRVVNDIDHGSF